MITDYPELIAEVSERSGVSDVVTRAKMFVGMAEKMLSKNLRLSEMETTIILTSNTDGEIDLPNDFQELRLVSVNNCQLKIKPFGVIQDGGIGCAIRSKKIISYYKSTPHTLTYYAAIPSLEENNTNWLLDNEPEMYLQAVLFQVYTSKTDIEKAQSTAGYLDQLIEAANDTDKIKQYTGSRIVLGGANP